jgi:hypothetical protein
VNVCTAEHAGPAFSITLSLVSDFSVLFFDKRILFRKIGCEFLITL